MFALSEVSKEHKHPSAYTSKASYNAIITNLKNQVTEQCMLPDRSSQRTILCLHGDTHMETVCLSYCFVIL